MVMDTFMSQILVIFIQKFELEKFKFYFKFKILYMTY